jgi:hypothetical protein
MLGTFYGIIFLMKETVFIVKNVVILEHLRLNWSSYES